MRISALAALVGGLALAMPSPGLAQEDAEDEAPEEEGAEGEPSDPDLTDADRESRIHFESGRAYYDRGDYESAAREFETGYARQPLAAFLYNLYLTYERIGDFGRAAERLESYLGTSAEVADRATLAERLENLRRRATDQPDPDPDPDPDPAPDPDPDPDPDPATDSGGGTDFTVPAIISFSAGGLGFVAFGIFAGLAASEDSRLEEECLTAFGTGGGYCDDDEVSTASTYALIADIGLGLGIAGAVTGVILLLLSDGPSDDHAARVAPMVGPTVAGLSAEVPIP